MPCLTFSPSRPLALWLLVLPFFTYTLSNMSAGNRSDVKNLRGKSGRFRILIIGRANAGKTTILRAICNSTENPGIYDGEGNKVRGWVKTCCCVVSWTARSDWSIPSRRNHGGEYSSPHRPETQTWGASHTQFPLARDTQHRGRTRFRGQW